MRVENNNKSGIQSHMENFPYPTCWENKQRMDELYLPFRNRFVNPENYDGKMKFWQNLIAQYCKHKGEATFSKVELQLAFAREHRTPQCLDTVIEEMLRLKQIRHRTEYEYDPLNSWTGWAVNCLVRKPMAWSVNKLKTTIGILNEEEAALYMEYIHLDVIKKFCDELSVQALDELEGKLLHFDTLRKNMKLPLTETCMRLCLHTLNCQRRIGLEYKQIENERQIHLVKIPNKSKGDVHITDTDRAVHNLQMTQSNLLKQLNALEADITQADEKARLLVNENQRNLAKTYLRKKHKLEKDHEKRVNALQNIEALLNSVEEALGHGEILDALKIGSKALQGVLAQNGLNYDNVDEIVGDVRETLEMHNDVQEMLANVRVKPADAGREELELERELSALMGEMESKTSPAKSPMLPMEPNVAMTKSDQIDNSDSELLQMLDKLELENGSPMASSSPLAKRVVNETTITTTPKTPAS